MFNLNQMPMKMLINWGILVFIVMCIGTVTTSADVSFNNDQIVQEWVADQPPGDMIITSTIDQTDMVFEAFYFTNDETLNHVETNCVPEVTPIYYNLEEPVQFINTTRDHYVNDAYDYVYIGDYSGWI